MNDDLNETKTYTFNYGADSKKSIIINEEKHRSMFFKSYESPSGTRPVSGFFHKIIEESTYSFTIKKHDYSFVLESHFTLDNKPLFKTIKHITEDGFVITSLIKDIKYKDFFLIVREKCDFPQEHHYNPAFFTKQWADSDDKPKDCKSLILKKFRNGKIEDSFSRKHFHNTKNVASVFSKDNLYTRITNSTISTFEKGFIQESEALLLDLIKKVNKISSQITFVDKNDEYYLSIMLLFFRTHLKEDPVAVDNLFLILDSTLNDYSTFESFCLSHICISVERMLEDIFDNHYHIAIFETKNPIGFFLSEDLKLAGTNYEATKIDSIILPLSPKKAVVFFHEKDYLTSFEENFERIQKCYLITSLHEIITSEKEISLIYKNDIYKSAENFIISTMNEPYMDYLKLPKEYKKVSILDIWNNPKTYDINIIIKAIEDGNKKIKYFKSK